MTESHASAGTCDHVPAVQAIPPLAPTEKLRQWFALYIIRNHEKRVEQHLRMKEVEVFLPLFRVVKRWRNNTNANVDLPLFPGYVFTRIADTERVRVLEVPGVVTIIGNSRGPLPLPDAEIETLQKGLHLRQADPYPYVQVGARARICSGPLAGLQGIVVRKDNQLRVVLSIELIMKSIAVHVTADELELCP